MNKSGRATWRRETRRAQVPATYPTQGVFEHGFQKSIPPQICQLIRCISNSTGYVDGFVGELTSTERLLKHFE